MTEEVRTPLPADLPTDWQPEDIVAPTGEEVGLTKQHGYNYLMEQVNAAQRGMNEAGERQTQIGEALQAQATALSAHTGSRSNPHNVTAQQLTGVLPIANGGTGAANSAAARVNLGAAPTGDPVFTGSISMGRAAGSLHGYNSVAFGEESTVSGDYSFAVGTKNHVSKSWGFAEGFNNTVSCEISHAEGRETISSGGYGSHSEGWDTQALEIASHAEGGQTIARGICSHAQGSTTIASGGCSFAGGDNTEASGKDSFAYGSNAKAKGQCSVAMGNCTIANGYGQFVVGLPNVEKTSESINGFSPDDLLIVGSGWSASNPDTATRSNCFRASRNGVFASGNYNASGADYAELFQWADGNPEYQDRVGRFVTLDGERIRLAEPDDDFILGIVSGCPSVVGDVYDDQWRGMYLTDIFGRTLWEDVDVPDEVREYPDPERPGKILCQVICPAHRERRQKLNPVYDSAQEYQPRTSRPEWGAVGMLGKLVMVDDGGCQVNGWCRPGPEGIAVSSKPPTRYRVMARLDETHIRVLIL